MHLIESWIKSGNVFVNSLFKLKTDCNNGFFRFFEFLCVCTKWNQPFLWHIFEYQFFSSTSRNWRFNLKLNNFKLKKREFNEKTKQTETLWKHRKTTNQIQNELENDICIKLNDIKQETIRNKKLKFWYWDTKTKSVYEHL